MLWKLLVDYLRLRPRRRLLIAVVVFQLAQSIASLHLPTLKADIIDEGVAKGGAGYILSAGSLMLFITLTQIAGAVTPVYFGAKAAMALGRDLRGAVSARVGEFSEQACSYVWILSARSHKVGGTDRSRPAELRIGGT